MPIELPTWEETSEVEVKLPSWEETTDSSSVTESHHLMPDTYVTPTVTEKPLTAETLNIPNLLPGGMNDPGTGHEMLEVIAADAIPAAKEALTYVGNVARGTVADIGVGIRTLGETKKEAEKTSVEYSGNLPAAIMGDPLPIDRALGEAALEDAERGQFPLASTIGHTSQGLAAMAPLAAVGLAPTVVQRLVALGFTIDMIGHAPELFNEYAEEINKPKEEQDPDKVAKLTSGIMQTFAFAPLAGKHGASVVPRGPLNPKFDARTGFSPPEAKSPEVANLERSGAPLTAKAVEATKPLNPGGSLKDLPPELQQKSNTVKDAMAAEFERLKSEQPPSKKVDTTRAENVGLGVYEEAKPSNIASTPANAKQIDAEQNQGTSKASGEASAKNLESSPNIAEGTLQKIRTLVENGTLEADAPASFTQTSGPFKDKVIVTKSPKTRGWQATLMKDGGKGELVPSGDAVFDTWGEAIASAMGDTVAGKPGAGSYSFLPDKSPTPPPKVKEGKYPERPNGEIEAEFAKRISGRGWHELTKADAERFRAYEYLAGGKRRDAINATQFSTPSALEKFHRAQVEQALKEGKPVPPEVLKDYPELQSSPKPTEPEPAGEVLSPERPEQPSKENTPPPPVEATQEIVGMGGAIPAEFENSPQTPTGIKNATVERERAARGLPPAVEPARRSFGEVWDRAMAEVDNRPEAQDTLIAELKAKPRAVTDLEDAMLLHRQIDLQNQYGKLSRELANEYEFVKDAPERMEMLEATRASLDATRNELYELYEINKKVGTETGRGLAARKMMAYEDFSLAAMELEARSAKGGAPLTPEETAKVAELQKTIEETQKRFDDYVAKAEEAKSSQLTDEAIAELRKRAEAGYDPRIIEIAETIVTKLEKQADKARERLKEKFKQVGSAPDPTILYDLGVVGAAKIARTGLDFAKFSLEMVKEFGEAVRPMLADAWKRSNEHLENEGAKYGDKAPQVRQLLRKMDEPKRRENITEDLKQAAKEKKPLEMVGQYVQKLAESFIRGGIKGREPLIDAVWEALKKDFDPNITRREAMDAISGYGKFKALNKSELKAQLRDLRGQMQQVAKLEDIQGKKPLQKTGVERRTPSDEERRLIQQVNESKRRFGVVVSDPAKQLKSALDAVKTRLTNQISDLEFQIKNRAKTVKTRTPSPTDAETVKLEARRDELKRQFDEIFPKQPMTDAQRVQLAMRATQKQIDELTTRIAKKDISEKAKRKGVTAPELEALRARRDALKDQHEELVNTLDPERAERLELAALKARISDNTAKYQERLANEDFTPKQKKEPPKMDAEALRLKAENEMAKSAWHKARQEWVYKNLTTGRKIWVNTKETMNLSRNILTGMDLSAVLRQGGLLGAAHPAMASKSLGPMLKAFASEKNSVMIEQQIKGRENYPLYERHKLYIAPHEALHLTKMEEAVASRWAGAIPIIKGSNRAYVTFLNKLRADAFDTIKASVEGRGAEMTPREMDGLANYINITTGRGDMGRFSPAAEALALAFFSPRLVTSRFQYLMGQPFFKAGSWRMRKVIAAEYARTLGTIAPILALGLAAGATLETDPRSSDFLKLKYGNTRVDLFSGLLQPTVFLSKMATGEQKTGGGDIKDARRGETTWNFLQSKLAPWPGAALDLRDIAVGQDTPPGHPKTLGEAGANLVTPITLGDIYEIMREQGIPKGTALSMLAILGAGVSTYRNDKGSEAAKEVLRGLPLEPKEKQKMLEGILKDIPPTPAPTNSTILQLR